MIGSSLSVADLPRSLIELPASHPPVLVIVIDTEEEFDWHAPFDRSQTSVSAMRAVGQAQQIFDRFGVRPLYVVDYPVASQQEGYERLREYLEEGRAVIGAHLHPWVTPPLEEEVCPRNSFPGNLPAELEAAKLHSLTEQIERSFGHKVTVYKAGRYGLGPNTPGILERQGFEVDLSACPPFDYTAESGPDYSCYSSDPYWFGDRRRLLGLPGTGAYVGKLRRGRHRLFSFANRPPLRRARVPGVLARLGVLERLRLSPEGFGLSELMHLTRDLFERGLRVFSLSFHSPSLKPGCTPYVRTRSELTRFLEVLRDYVDFFLSQLGGMSKTPLELRRHLEAQDGGQTRPC